MFEWDEAKNATNRQKHGISFEDILPIFDRAENDGLIFEDTRQDYREARFILLCPFKTAVFHVTFTRRLGRTRLISARRANRREVEAYERRKYH